MKAKCYKNMSAALNISPARGWKEPKIAACASIYRGNTPSAGAAAGFDLQGL